MTGLLKIYDEKIAAGALKPDPAQRHAIAALDKLSASLESALAKRGFFSRKPAAPKGFYFYGGVGRGKSMVMDLFFANCDIEKKRRVHFHAFMLEVHDYLYMTRQNREEHARIDDDLLACAEYIADKTRLLCFDEFQVKDVADAMIIGRLFTALFDHGVTVIMTSNICPDDLYADGLQRDRFLPFIELLKEKLEVFSFDGEVDYRLHRLAGLKTYFWPADDDAHESLEKIFAAVADGEKGAPQEIAVKGRSIHVPRAARGAAFFSFAELCETPKSALDYLELAKRFNVFIVEGVPKLDDTQRNAVLRFVTLVDTLYDHHARIALSAAVPPERLYSGEEHAGVFARTVSRLMEMQSRDYGLPA